MINYMIANNKIDFVIFAELHHVTNECQNKKTVQGNTCHINFPLLSVEEFVIFLSF